MIDDTLPAFPYPAISCMKIGSAFDGGRITTDDGVMLSAAMIRDPDVSQELNRSTRPHRVFAADQADNTFEGIRLGLISGNRQRQVQIAGFCDLARQQPGRSGSGLGL